MGPLCRGRQPGRVAPGTAAAEAIGTFAGGAASVRPCRRRRSASYGAAVNGDGVLRSADRGARPRPDDAAGAAGDAGDAGGLSVVEAARRLAADGPNQLPQPRGRSVARRFAAEFVHFFALMLWVAAALAFVAGLPQLAVAIVVVVVVNGAFAFAQQQRAQRAAEKLRQLLPAGVTVRRDGVDQVVAAAEVVCGDVVVLHAGDRLPADGQVRRADGVRVDESMLTGESVPRSVGERDAVFGGTFVTVGDGEVVITATAARTRLAQIAKLTSDVHRPRSPLALELDRVVRVVASLAVGVGLSFFGLSMLIGASLRDGFLFAVGVTVALVPEGLLPTVTLSLAIGAQRMAARHALVRNLEAVETLGSTTFICTDKTGTLTRNEMSVEAVWTPHGMATVEGVGYEPIGTVHGAAGHEAAVRELALDARACSQGRIRIERADGVEGARWLPVGDPMEAAIDAFARRVLGETGEAFEPDPVLHRFGFDPQRRRETVLLHDRIVTKGAPEAVLAATVDPSMAARAETAVHELAERGLRVLAVARRTHRDEDATPSSAGEAERELELLGLLGFEDPPRPEVFDALAACRRAGVKVAMLTGDHPATARAIAEQIGLLGHDGSGAALVLDGATMPADDAVLGALLDRDGVVISRVAPEDKLRITRVLQQRGHVVAMTGDGVNDGPALREADIGVAMGRSGTDVAREAADLVLLDDNFATIVAAIEAGRSTFANIRRFLTYHLSDNVAELTPFAVWALSGGRFPLAIGVLQVLCLDIGTDLLPALALGAEPPPANVLDGPPPRRHLVDGGLLRRAFGVLGATEALVEMTAFTVALVAAGWRPGGTFPTGVALAAASGAAFSAVVLGQIANAFACRSARRPVWRTGWRGNRLLVGAVAVELVALVGFIGVGPVARLLEHRPPPLAGLLVALCAVPAVWSADALHKHLRARRTGRSGGVADRSA
ncbi:MAG: cation-transporting P-type ATPase [Acidimicrobiales bacterium]|nr:cation-transporting P-type ATPase [Acidimicrobiales bacterium]